MKFYLTVILALSNLINLFAGNTILAPLIVGGTINGSTSVCYGNNSGSLNLTGNTADVIRWEYSTSGGSPWSTINFTERNLPYQNLITTTYFRAVVSDGIDVEYSTVGIITVSPAPNGGNITGQNEQCITASGTLELSGHTGNIVRWEYSTTPGTWINISNTTDHYSYSNLLFNTDYRAIVQTPGCSETASEIFSVTVFQPTVGGTLNGGTSVCENNNSTTLNLSGATGEVISWEISQTGDIPWTKIVDSEGQSSMTFNNLNSSNYYRVVVQSPGCSVLRSSTASILVNTTTVPGYLIGGKEVCAQNNTGSIGLVSNLGNIVHWEYSENNGNTWNIISNSSGLAQYDYVNLTNTTIYRVQIKNGVCSAMYTPNTQITVSPLPNVNFQVNNVCNNKKANFTDQTLISSGYIKDFIWEFGNGERAYINNPVYQYPASGIYEVKLSAISDRGCIDSLKKNINIYPKPNVSFSAEDVCNAETARFVNSSTISSGSMDFSWNFGDSQGSSSDENPAYIYANPGLYQVKLIAVSDNNCKDSITNSIEVFPLATPQFSFEDVCNGTKVSFSNNSFISSGSYTSDWDFGDSQASTEYNPKHLYQDPGVYSVRLRVISSKNCVQELTKTVNVNPVPNTAFMVRDTCVADILTLTNLSTISSGSLTYHWNFGDGGISDQSSPVYSYRNPGNYLIALNAVSDRGCEKSTSLNVDIFPMPNANYTAENECFNDSIKFINISNISAGSLNYKWTFDDNSFSDMKSPSHLYNIAKTYAVKLVTTSGNGCADSISRFVEVYPKPIADFVAPTFCDGSVVTFLNLSSIDKGELTNYLWDFGDGTNSVQKEPSKLYYNPDEYTVSLQVFSEFGCSDTIARSFRPVANPVANFTVENVCFNNFVTPNNLTESDGTYQFVWAFGDGNSSSLIQPEHLYSMPGIYAIELKATSLQGCADSLKRNIIIYPLPNTYAGNDTTVSRGYPLNLSADGGINFIWSPTQGLDDPFAKNPVAKLSETTSFVLQSENEFGCFNYDTLNIVVLNDYKLEASNIITPNQDGYNDFWVIYNIESFDDCLLSIYDRWGKQVYFKRGYQNDWDGRNMNNDILPDGTYYYVIEFEGASRTYKGAITIFRNK